MVLASAFGLLAEEGTAGSNDDAARAAFLKGADAYRNVEFSEALLYFEEAYKLRPSYKILYNIAQTQLELRRPHLALEAFEKYLIEGRKEIDATRRDEVLHEIKKLRRVVGEIIVTGKTGTECRIDNEHVGFLPLAGPVRLAAGSHEITVHLHGEVICRKDVEIVAGKKRIEPCNPQGEESEEEGPEPESAWDVMSNTTLGEYEMDMAIAPRKEPSRLWTVSPWIFTGAAAVTAVTGTILALKTSSLNAELTGACDNGDCPSSRAGDVERLPRLAMAADIMFVATSVLSATAFTLFILRKKKERSDSVSDTGVKLEEDLTLHPVNRRGDG